MNNIFFERLEEQMKSCKLSNPNQIAKKIGVPNQTIKNWYDRNTIPKIEILWKLADIFGCSIDYLCGREDDQGVIAYAPQPTPELSSEEKELLEFYRKIPQKSKNALMEMAKSISELSEQIEKEKQTKPHYL